MAFIAIACIIICRCYLLCFPSRIKVDSDALFGGAVGITQRRVFEQGERLGEGDGPVGNFFEVGQGGLRVGGGRDVDGECPSGLGA